MNSDDQDSTGLATTNGFSELEIADLKIDVRLSVITKGGRPLKLSDKSFALLRTLLESAPETVGTREIEKAVWGDVHVSPDALTQRIKLLRTALGAAPDGDDYIATVHGKGYRLRFLPEVLEHASPGQAPTPKQLILAILLAGFFFVLYQALDQAGALHGVHRFFHNPPEETTAPHPDG